MAINWIKGKWDCKKYALVILKPDGTYRVPWKRYGIELLYLKLCLLRNICAITQGKWKGWTIMNTWRRNWATKEMDIMKEVWKQMEGGHRSSGYCTLWVQLCKQTFPWKAFTSHLFFWAVPIWKINICWMQSLELCIHLLLPLCHRFPDPAGSFTPMSFITLCHWKTHLSSHSLSLTSDCFLMLWLQ